MSSINSTPQSGKPKVSDIPTPMPLSTLAAASALVLASCATTSGLPEEGRSMQEVRAEAEQELDDAIRQTRRQKQLLAQVEQAGGGTHNHQMPAQNSVPTLNDVQPLSEQSVMGIVNQGQDPRPTRPSMPHMTADRADYPQAGQHPMMALAEKKIMPPTRSQSEQGQTAPIYDPYTSSGNNAATPPSVYTPIANSAATDEYIPRYTPKPRNGRNTRRPKGIGTTYATGKAGQAPASVRSNRIPVSLVGLDNINPTAPPAPPPERKPTTQAAPKEKWAGYSGSLRPSADKVLHLPTQRQPDVQQYAELNKELDAPLNGTVRVSMVLAAIAKAIGYEFSLQGEDKDFSMKFENFNGTVLDLLKAVGGKNGLDTRGIINVLPKQKRIILKYH